MRAHNVLAAARGAGNRRTATSVGRPWSRELLQARRSEAKLGTVMTADDRCHSGRVSRGSSALLRDAAYLVPYKQPVERSSRICSVKHFYRFFLSPVAVLPHHPLMVFA